MMRSLSVLAAAILFVSQSAHASTDLEKYVSQLIRSQESASGVTGCTNDAAWGLSEFHLRLETPISFGVDEVLSVEVTPSLELIWQKE